MVSMQSLDRDGDGQISQSEFEDATGGVLVFADFDSNGDGTIDQQEMSQGAFARYDTDGDQRFSEDEYALYEQEFRVGSGMSGDAAGSDDMAASTGLQSDLSVSSDLETDMDSTEMDTMSSAIDVSAATELGAEGDMTGANTTGAMGGRPGRV